MELKKTKLCKKCKKQHLIEDFIEIKGHYPDSKPKFYCKKHAENNLYKHIPFGFPTKYCPTHKKSFPLDHFIKVELKNNKIVNACKENYLNNGGRINKLKNPRKYPEKINSKYGYKKNTKEWTQAIWLRRKYNLTLDDYNTMLAEQKECCAICKKHKNNFKKNFAVDHNHETGEIRGLLCSTCNKAIGIFKDNIFTIKKAINYILLHESK